jgi:hypothetical protein
MHLYSPLYLRLGRLGDIHANLLTDNDNLIQYILYKIYLKEICKSDDSQV